MQTTVCAYCDHEVKITPNGVCLFCGGNLSEEPFEEKDESSSSRTSKIQEFILGYPVPTKSREELVEPFISKSERETNLQSIRRMLEKEEQKRKESQLRKEMKELDTYTKIVSESTTVKDLVKSLDKPLIPFWLKFGVFVIGLMVSMSFSFPRVQDGFVKILTSINDSPITIMAMSIIPILFLLSIIKKFDRF